MGYRPNLPQIGDRVRLQHDATCEFCVSRDPAGICDGEVGVVVSLIPITFTDHFYEVAFDAGTLLRNVPVPYFGGTVDLPEPNYSAGELIVLQGGASG